MRDAAALNMAGWTTYSPLHYAVSGNLTLDSFEANPNVTTHCSTTNNITCNVNVTTPKPAFGRNESLAQLEITIQAIILFLAIFGNGIVILVLLGMRRRKKLSRMNMMIVHLSFADLFVAFFNVLPQLAWDITYRFHGNDFLCRSVKFGQVVAMYASSYVLVSTSIDR